MCARARVWFVLVRVCRTNQLLMQMTCCCPTSAPLLVRIRAPHTPATNTYTHSLSEPDSTAPGPAARQRRTHPGFQVLQPAVTVDLTSPYFVDMGDMGDPPKSKKLIRCWDTILKLNSTKLDDDLFMCSLLDARGQNIFSWPIKEIGILK